MFSSKEGFRFVGGLIDGPYMATYGANGTIYAGTMNDVLTNSTGSNVYIFGPTEIVSSGDRQVLLLKQNIHAFTTVQKELGNTATSDGLYEDGAIDSSENIYVCGRSTGITSAPAGMLVKYNSSGALQWQRGYYHSNGGVPQTTSFKSVAVEPGGANIYASGGAQYYDSPNATFNTYAIVVKYNSDGNVLAQYRDGTTYSNEILDIKTDSSNNFYVSGTAFDTANSAIGGSITKYYPNAVSQWSVNIQIDSANTSFGVCNVDSNGNVIVLNQPTGGPGQITKIHANGVIDWIKSSNSNHYFQSCCFDSGGNIIVVGTKDTGNLSTYAGTFSKYYANGDVIFQNQITSTVGGVRPLSVTQGNSFVYISGSIYNSIPWVTRLSDDGSDIGTFGPYTISASSITLTSSTSSDLANSINLGTATTNTNTASNLNSINSSITRSVVIVT